MWCNAQIQYLGLCYAPTTCFQQAVFQVPLLHYASQLQQPLLHRVWFILQSLVQDH
jgi:hypothetical protein